MRVVKALIVALALLACSTGPYQPEQNQEDDICIVGETAECCIEDGVEVCEGNDPV